jgi:tRNA-2-methylthio-N6-dimethylallyladenosine synthase
MNRQYRHDDYLKMIDAVRSAFDRPALTSDIIVAFPGETAADFAHTLDIVDRCGFIHIHAFPFSPRPGTPAARWKLDAATRAAAADRMTQLQQRAQAQSFSFRRQFLNCELQLLVERSPAGDAPWQYGRCDRYFPIHFLSGKTPVGSLVNVRVDQVTPERAVGVLS